MYAGFPIRHLALIRCPVDGGELVADSSLEYVRRARLRCHCGFTARIDDGILSLGATASHEQSERERALRDEEYSSRFREQLCDWDLMEMRPVLAALELTKDDCVLELGAGSGRYTLPLAESCSDLVAMDFSRAGLLRIAQRLPDHAPVSLVWADIESLRPSPGAFSAVVSTLTSNLPTSELRAEMFRLAARALQSGRFVSVAHHWGPSARIRGLQRDGYYDGTGVFRHFMTASELCLQAAEFFQLVEARPVRVIAPGAGRLGLPPVQTSRLLERVPLVRRFGDLLLCLAQYPKLVEPARPRKTPATSPGTGDSMLQSPVSTSLPCPTVPIPHSQRSSS